MKTLLRNYDWVIIGIMSAIALCMMAVIAFNIGSDKGSVWEEATVKEGMYCIWDGVIDD